MKEQINSRGFSRRNFIKGAAAVTAMGALAGCTPQSDNLESVDPTAIPETKIYSGACRAQCSQGCYLDVHVRDGQVVRTTAGHFHNDPSHDRICPKGLSQVGRIYSAERLQYPMKRVGERGEGKFERISWDEAIKTITDNWKENFEKYGRESVGFFLGSGNTALLGGGTADGSVMQHLMEVLGVCSILPDRDIALQNRISAMIGKGMYTNPAQDWCNAKHLVVWAADMAVSEKQWMHFLLEARDAGVQVTNIDIRYNTVSSKSDWFVPVSPATDGALCLGILREVFDNNWQDMEFLRNGTEAPFLVKEDGKFLRMSDLGVAPTPGKNMFGQDIMIDPNVVWDEETGKPVPPAKAGKPALEGVPAKVKGFKVETVYDKIKARVYEWTVEQASEITHVPVEDIKKLAHMYGQEGPVTTIFQFGVNHYNNGLYSIESMLALILITGNIGKAGSGIGGDSGSFGIANAQGCIMQPDINGNPVRGKGRDINWNVLYETIHTQTKLGEPFPFKSIYCSCTNIVSNQTEQNETIKALKEVEFLAVQEMTMSDTALYADILLPACHWFECEDLRVRAYAYPYLLLNEKAVEPMYESKPDFEIYKMLADAMGESDYFAFSEEEYISKWLDIDYARQNNVTLETMKEYKAMCRTDQPDVRFADLKFPTPSGRAVLYLEDPQPDHNIGQEVDLSKEHLLLYWEPAMEADLDNPIREKFPFIMCGEHMRTRTHSQWWDVAYMKEYEPYPLVRINPDDAAGLGIKDGDTVRMYNDRGSATMIAVLNPGEQPGVVHSPRSFLTREHIDGDQATLTRNDYNQVCRNQSYYDCAVAIEKL